MVVETPGTLDALVAIALQNIISDFTIWGIFALVIVGVILTMLKTDGYASAMIMYVFITIFGGPVIGVLQSPIFQALWWFSTLVAAFFIVIAMLKIPGGDLR